MVTKQGRRRFVTNAAVAGAAGFGVLGTLSDRPWSQYFCCMFAGNSEFIRKYPVATKRAVRAILKAADICVSEPRRAAQLLVDRGHANATTMRCRR